jgi:hypothetical protein
VVRIPGFKSRGSGFDSQIYKIFRVARGLERGPLSGVRINKELLERKVADHAIFFIHKFGTKIGRMLSQSL